MVESATVHRRLPVLMVMMTMMIMMVGRSTAKNDADDEAERPQDGNISHLERAAAPDSLYGAYQ